MPTFLGQSFAPGWTGKPPGMAPRDVDIWQRWRDINEKELIRVYYNVRVGGGVPPEGNNTPEQVIDWLMLTMLRIDVVAEFENHVLICELRPNAGRALFGALIIYNQLWAADPPIQKPFYPMGITDNATAQIKAIFTLNRLGLDVV